MRAYLLAYDPRFGFGPDLHAALIDSPYVYEWWHYLSGTYLLTSNQDLITLDTDVKRRWPDGWYILVEVKKPIVGWLSHEGWNWINSRVH
jgi:hypothetical protein